MSTVTITLPDPLDATLAERVKISGARSKEEYLLSLVESDCAAGELEHVVVPGPLAMLGDARQFHAGEVPTTDKAMRELREGDHD
jgi:hypothetical protein